MRGKVFLIAAMLLICLVSTVAYAQWTPSDLTVVGSSEKLVLTPSWQMNGSKYAYSYDLSNVTSNDYVIGFTLAFDQSVPVTDFSDIITPEGWSCIVRTLSNKLAWELGVDELFSLAPGATKTFGFSSTFGPSSVKNVNTSSQDSYGFSGTTFGPAVPEPGSLLALASGLIGLVGLRSRKK